MFARLQFDILGNCASFYFVYKGQIYYLQHSLLQSHYVKVLYRVSQEECARLRESVP